MDATECARAASFLSHLGDGALCHTADGAITAWNPAAETMFGYPAHEILGHPLDRLFAPGTDVSRSRTPGNGPIPAIGLHRDGYRLNLTVSRSPFLDAVGRPIGAVLLLRDERRKTVREPQAMLCEAIVHSAADAIVTHDLAGRITSWNASAETLYGYRADEALGRPHSLLCPPERHAQEAALLARVRCGTRLTDVEALRLKKDGTRIQISTSLAPLQANGDVCGVCDAARDLGDYRLRLDTALGWALEDPLTQLPNRRALLDRLGVAMRKSERTGCLGALLFVDLDDFKQVNDRAGHAAGDRVLAEVANRIRKLVRDADTAARLGGDEFVVLLEELDGDASVALVQAESLAGKLLRALEDVPGAAGTRCSASVGVTLFSGLSLTDEQLLSRADGAMYAAKHAGKNRVRSLREPGPTV